MQKTISALILVLTMITLVGCGSSPDMAQAVEYQTIETKKHSNSRHRVERSIYAAEAKTKDQFAHTAMKAALDLQKETGAKVVIINLREDHRLDVALSMVFYAPDGGGFSGDQGWTWDVKATDKRHDEEELRMSTLWWRNRDRFQVSDGYGGTETDEEALSKFIGETMGIAPDKVTLAYFDQSEYLKQ